MLGRRVADALVAAQRPLLDEGVLAVAHEADLFLVNLECCISDRGFPRPNPRKRFFFRAPPRAADELARWGVHGVTLANNHIMDYGAEALLDTIDHLDRVGIRHAGAGRDLAAARAPARLTARGVCVALVAVADWPVSLAAGADRPGIAYADLRVGDVGWLPGTIETVRRDADLVVVSPHWGLNWTHGPSPGCRAAAGSLADRVTLIWGHSAHVPHGVWRNVLYDSGDFLTDFNVAHRESRAVRIAHRGGREVGGLVGSAIAGVRGGGVQGLGRAVERRLRGVHRLLRLKRLHGDLQVLFLVTIVEGRLERIEVVPLKLTESHTRLAQPEESLPLKRRFRAACAALGTKVGEERGRWVVTPAASP